MRYYVVSDVHGYFSELQTALKEKGYFEDTQPHQLIICGDLYDRGSEALQLQEFILDLLDKNEVILIRGNHEDLALDLLNKWTMKSYLMSHHHSNKTIDTILQLTKYSMDDLFDHNELVARAFLKDPYIQTIIPQMRDYYETKHYIFVHGWIPCQILDPDSYYKEYIALLDFRKADDYMWNRARWMNGMEAWHNGVREKGKTIVCGHWHCSFGHCHYEGKGGEFENADFSPFYGEGIIAIDACTAFSKKVNCLVIDDEEK